MTVTKDGDRPGGKDSAGEGANPIERLAAAIRGLAMRSPFLRLLARDEEDTLLRITGYALVAGVFQGVIIVVVNLACISSIERRLEPRDLLLFASSIALFTVASRAALTFAVRNIENALMKVRLGVADGLRRLSLRAFEETKKETLYTALTREAEILSSLIVFIFNGLIGVVMLLFAVAFVATQSSAAFLLFVFALLGGCTPFLLAMWGLPARQKESDRREGEFLRALNDFLDGFKEVKLNARRNEALFRNCYMAAVAEAARLRYDIKRFFSTNYVAVSASFFGAIGVILFARQLIGLTDPTAVFMTIMSMLFIIGPLSLALEVASCVWSANAAAGQIERLEETLAGLADPQPAAVASSAELPQDAELSLRAVTHTYRAPDGSVSFRLGPIDLLLRRGETVFLTGGNGSGKTTLIKILTGLYPPEEGELHLGGVRITSDNLPAYRALFATVFSDFHLFDRFYGREAPPSERVNERLREMRLTDKTEWDEAARRFTRLDLSTGQRKRLALVSAVLEEKPICLFDEPAADQDPGFRRHFYEKLLPELKRAGRTVIVASHDARYFATADRVLHLDDGKLEPASGEKR